MKKRCVIIGAAEISKYKKLKTYLNPLEDFYIFCDNGLSHQKKLGIDADLIIGDFDSHSNPLKKAPELKDKTIILPREKDDTDTVFATKKALELGFKDFLFLGVCGQRMDHTLVNISILEFLFAQNVKAKILDDFSEMEIVGKSAVYVDDSWKYFSLVNICGLAQEITIKNAKFPLENATVDFTYQYATSNEVLPGKVAEISVGKGNLLLVKVFDSFN